MENSSAVKVLVELMSRLPTATQGRIYDTYVKPVNDLMRAIHIDYVTAFHAARHKLREEDYTIRDPQQRIRHQLQEVYDTIWQRRKIYEDKRDILRQEAQAYIANLRVIEAKRFFVAVCDYLVMDDNAGFIWTGSERDSFIEELADRGGLTMYSTPTTAFLRRIKEAQSLDAACEIINISLEALNAKYFNIVNAYVAFEEKRHLFN